MSHAAVKVAPSVLSADFARLGEQVQEAERHGADLIHIDVMDGRFVPNITMGPLVVEAIRRSTTLPLDVHLMIVEPEKHIPAFVEAGADRITIHVEATTNVHRTLLQIQEAGLGVGIALNPHTPAEALQEVLYLLDVITVMTVNPGFGGQKFIPQMTTKITKLREMVNESGREIDIQVDGGINHETTPTVVQVGANVLIVGSYVFSNEQGIQHGIEAVRSAIPD